VAILLENTRDVPAISRIGGLLLAETAAVVDK